MTLRPQNITPGLCVSRLVSPLRSGVGPTVRSCRAAAAAAAVVVGSVDQLLAQRETKNSKPLAELPSLSVS